MALSPELLQLVENLRRVRSPAKRMRVLAGAWKSFKGLSRSDRREVARKLGIRGFERVAETIGVKGGLEPDEIDGLLRQVEDMDASKTSDLISKLRHPAGRRELARKGLLALAGRREPERGTEGQGARAPGESAGEAGSLEASAQPQPGLGPAPGPAASRFEAAGSEESLPGGTSGETSLHPGNRAGAALETRVAGAPVGKPAPSEREGPARPVPGGPPAPDEPSQEDLFPEEGAPTPPIIPPRAAIIAPIRAEPEGSGPSEAAIAPPSPGEGPRAARAGAVSPEVLAGRMDRARSLVARMRLLREFLESGGRLDGAGTRDVLSRLPEGWARRRALDTVLRRGHPAGFDEAVRLLEEIPSPAGRDWCLTALARGRRLTEGQLDRLCALAGSVIVARRLRALQAGHR